MSRCHTRQAYTVRPRPQTPERPFDTPAEAWFWSARALLARADGARFEAGSAAFARPCEPDDVVCAAMALVRARRLGAVHLRALATFGEMAAPPDPRLCEHAWAVRPWDEAMDRLTGPLCAKGIVRAPERAGDGDPDRDGAHAP